MQKALIQLAPPLLFPGHAALRCAFVASRFAIVGPAADPALVAEAPTAAEAMRRIAAQDGPFLSRGDSSGTHVKELALWTAAGGVPAGRPWYVQAGADQAATLRVADERRAYALADLPTFSRLRGLELRVLFADDTALENVYTLYVVRSPAPHPAAATFAPWALAEWRRRLPASFTPRPGGCAATTEAVP